MLMSRLRTDTRTDGNVKVEQYSAEAESAIFKTNIGLLVIYTTNFPLSEDLRILKS